MTVFSYSGALPFLSVPLFLPRRTKFRSGEGREISMKDIFQVLREKELAIIRVQSEIAALRVVTPILAEESDRRDNELTGRAPQLVATGTEN